MAGRKINPWLKLGLELGPVVAFFIADCCAYGVTDTSADDVAHSATVMLREPFTGEPVASIRRP